MSTVMIPTDPSCGSRWKFPTASANLISSGFYTFNYDSSHQLAFPFLGIGVADMTSPDAKSVASTLWYYDYSNNAVLYNWGWKGSMSMVNCSDPAGGAISAWNGSHIHIEAGGTIYSPDCSKFISPTGLTSGTFDALHLLPSASFPVTIRSQAPPSLPTIGSIQTNTVLKFLLGYGSTMQNQELYLSVDTSHNLIADPGTGSNGIDWTYSDDKSLSMKLADETIVYLTDLPASRGIRSNGIAVPSSLIGNTPAIWSVPKIDYTPGNWPFPNYSIQGPSSLNKYFGATSSFLYNDTTQQYLVFGWNAGTNTIIPSVSLYPSPQSFDDILSSVNVTYVNLPPKSIPSGLYYIQTVNNGQCLRQDLTLGDCSWNDAAWNYDASQGILGTVKGGTCLASSLDSSCAGNGQLKTVSCSQADGFVLGTNGEFFLDRCGICYAPSNSALSVGIVPCDKRWTFKTASSSRPSLNKWWIIVILIIACGLFIFILRGYLKKIRSLNNRGG